MKIFRYIIVLYLILITISLNAQELKGRITEKNEKGELAPIAGANIYWVGINIGTTTNANGEFILKRAGKNNHMLVVSFVGFKSDTLHVEHDHTFIEHSLVQDVYLDNLTVKGYSSGAHFQRLNTLSAQVVTKNELQKAACCNLSESFVTNASVDVSYSDAVTGAKQIQLLGLAGTYTQLQAENIPILRGLGSTFGLNFVPGSWMESIQISKGTASVANGYESITGQINIEYKKPMGEEKFYINTYTNDEAMSEVNANYGFTVTDKLSSMVLAHAEYSQNRVDHNMDSFLDHPLVRQYNLFNRWNYHSDKLESQFGIKYLQEERVAGNLKYKSGDIITPGNPFGIDVSIKRFETFSKVGYIFDRPETTIGLINSISHHDQESIFGLKNYDASQLSYNSNLIFITYIGTTNHILKTGLSLNLDNYNEKLNTLNLDRKEVVPGGYFEYTYKFFEKFTFMSGIRYDYHNKYNGFVTPRAHIRYQPFEQLTLRSSVGKGFRSASIISENSYLLASSRNIIISEAPKMEEALNIGLNATQRYKLFNRELTISTDYYRTDFNNQIVVDMNQDVNSIYFYNLKGKSYSNSFQVEVSYQPFERFDVTAAWRLNDVKTTINGKLEQKPLLSKYKGLISLGYKTALKKWQFDYSIQFNGGGNLPDMSGYPVDLQRKSTFAPYTIMNAQITKYFRKFEVYLGGENLTDFMQKNPIISPNDPYSPYFDASMVWGPITGRKIYVGIRMTIFK
ncbi:MAG TPA: TonB-dependent receptor [Bacteroidales bacterium]|nr:TonB-dependent receptor [Bacteroidales bacterium]